MGPGTAAGSLVMQLAEGVLMMARLSQGTAIIKVPAVEPVPSMAPISLSTSNMKDILSDNMTLMKQFETFGV